MALWYGILRQVRFRLTAPWILLTACNDEPIGGIKVVARNGWFAARSAGTEDVYKIYAESFLGEDHLRQIQHDAQTLIASHFH